MLTMSCPSPSAIQHLPFFLLYLISYDVHIIFFRIIFLRTWLEMYVVILASNDLSLKLVCLDSLHPYNKIRYAELANLILAIKNYFKN